MKKVIVTGANGFVGTALMNYLCSIGINVIALVRERRKAEVKFATLKGIRLIYCNMSEISELPERVLDRDIDTCIHLAWEGSFGEERGNYEIQLSNVRYSLNTVDIMADMGVKRFVGIGTLAEKDVLYYQPTDGARPNAVSIYGCAKLAANYMTKAECSKRGIEHVWCHLSNTFGIGNTTNNFINMACRKMLKGERASFTLGEQLYDFVYITDAVHAIYLAAQAGKVNSSYYLGSTYPRKLKEFVSIIRDVINPEIQLYFGEVPYYGVSLPAKEYDTGKLIEDTGFKQEISFEEGIKKTVAWLKDVYIKEDCFGTKI